MCEVVLKRPVEIFREAQDGGQDAVPTDPQATMAAPAPIGTVQVKHTSEATKSLSQSDVSAEIEHVKQFGR